MEESVERTATDIMKEENSVDTVKPSTQEAVKDKNVTHNHLQPATQGSSGEYSPPNQTDDKVPLPNDPSGSEANGESPSLGTVEQILPGENTKNINPKNDADQKGRGSTSSDLLEIASNNLTVSASNSVHSGDSGVEDHHIEEREHSEAINIPIEDQRKNALASSENNADAKINIMRNVPLEEQDTSSRTVEHTSDETDKVLAEADTIAQRFAH